MKIAREWLVGVAISLMGAGCSTSTCPTIACQPEIHLSYQTPIAGSYSVSVVVTGSTFTAACPLQGGGLPGITSCDQSGIVVSGVNLGHGTNDTVDVQVSLNGGAGIDTKANLSNITNSRECDLICFVHTGTVAN